MRDKASWNPPTNSGIIIDWVEANGVRFEVAKAGNPLTSSEKLDRKPSKLALCLHGFPELHFSWRHQMPLLAEMGYQVWAPNLRGYGGTSKPNKIRDYALDNLCADVAALIDASEAEEVTLIAHDWGAIIAWAFAIQKIRPLKQLIIMNVPHPMVGLREIKKWRQFRRSWYIFFFQLPRIPEWLLIRNRGERIKQAFLKMAVDKDRFQDEDLQIYADAAMRPNSINSMINFYRALLRHNDSIDIGDGHVDAPTLMIWGEEDSALNINCTEGTEEWVSDFTLHKISNTSHWVQQEAPEKVNKIIKDWLTR